MKYEFWMAGIQGVAAQKKIRLRECMKSAEAIYYIEEIQLRQFGFLNDNECNKIMQAAKTGNFSRIMRKWLKKGYGLYRTFRKSIRKV